jgi:hypothetical protein
VCGLRLTCDPDCDGNVRIGEGFAIDNCGNDLVVCGPMPFDVIAALEAKNWLITEPPADPCDKKKPPRCKVKQCFYVAICYDEVPAEFTTPFKTSCGPNAAACEPTRIRETVRFDVLETPPKACGGLEEIAERVSCCWKLLTDSPLSRTMREHFGDDWSPEAKRDYCQIFCQLQVWFSQHLKRWPDLYDCTLAEKVCELKCPKEESNNFERFSGVFYELFRLIFQYICDCVLGEMIFPCPNPHEAHCVGLGTVEVEDGKVVRVCNCPRTYVWSFAHFFEVLLAIIVGGAACSTRKKDDDAKENAHEGSYGSHHEHKGKTEICCANLSINGEQFLELFRFRSDFGRFAALAPVHVMSRSIEALRTGFSFTDPLAFSPEIFKGMPAEKAQQLAVKLAGRQENEGNVLEFVEEKHVEAADPITVLLSHLLKRPGDPLVATLDDHKNVAKVYARSQLLGPRDQPIENRVKAAEEKAAAAQATVATLTNELNELKNKMDQILGQQRPPAGGTTPPAGPAAPQAGGGPNR